MSVPAVTPATTDEKPGPRVYVVLRETADGNWEPIGTGKALTTDGAIRAAAKDKEGRYVAVSRRSWQPRNLAVKTETKAVLS